MGAREQECGGALLKLRRAYALVANLWCNPQDVEVEKVREEALEIGHILSEMDPEGAAYLERFLGHYPPGEEEYIELFELNPRCPLYLGSHAFDEPKTCAQAAVSDRNEYMIDLIGIYKHFGLGPQSKELPDYLPLMVEFLALTADKQDPIRKKFIQEYFLPFLPPFREKLAALASPYLDLLGGLERLLRLDLEITGGQLNVLTFMFQGDTLCLTTFSLSDCPTSPFSYSSADRLTGRSPD